jgi:hypothetical protein
MRWKLLEDNARMVCMPCCQQDPERQTDHNRRCVDTFPGQCCNGGPWNAGRDSRAADIRYGTDTHQQGMPCEVRR